MWTDVVNQLNPPHGLHISGDHRPREVAEIYGPLGGPSLMEEAQSSPQHPVRGGGTRASPSCDDLSLFGMWELGGPLEPLLGVPVVAQQVKNLTECL